MSKKVIISVKGTQCLEDGENDDVELITEGEYAFRNGRGTFRYEESEMTGMDGTTTVFKFSPEEVVISREGTVSSRMVFVEGKRNIFLYETPFGELSVDIQTSELKHNLSERGGLMEIKYSIAVEHTVTGRNCFKIRVRRKH